MQTVTLVRILSNHHLLPWCFIFAVLALNAWATKRDLLSQLFDHRQVQVVAVLEGTRPFAEVATPSGRRITTELDKLKHEGKIRDPDIGWFLTNQPYEVHLYRRSTIASVLADKERMDLLAGSSMGRPTSVDDFIVKAHHFLSRSYGPIWPRGDRGVPEGGATGVLWGYPLNDVKVFTGQKAPEPGARAQFIRSLPLESFHRDWAGGWQGWYPDDLETRQKLRANERAVIKYEEARKKGWKPVDMLNRWNDAELTALATQIQGNEQIFRDKSDELLGKVTNFGLPPSERIEALIDLGELGPLLPHPRERILSLLRNRGNHEKLRAAALDLLAQPENIDEKIERQLLFLLEDFSVDVRIRAFQALEGQPGLASGHLKHIRAAARGDSNESVKRICKRIIETGRGRN